MGVFPRPVQETKNSYQTNKKPTFFTLKHIFKFYQNFVLKTAWSDYFFFYVFQIKKFFSIKFCDIYLKKSIASIPQKCLFYYYE
jgi:hypothetical protein